KQFIKLLVVVVAFAGLMSNEFVEIPQILPVLHEAMKLSGLGTSVVAVLLDELDCFRVQRFIAYQPYALPFVLAGCVHQEVFFSVRPVRVNSQCAAICLTNSRISMMWTR